MLLQVLYSVRSERLLMEQVQYNLLFRWFIGLSMDDKVWAPTVFTKNRQRLIEHGAVQAFFERVLAQAEQRNWLSKEHFSVDGTLIQAWASHKSFVPKDSDAGEDSDAGDPDAGDGSHFRGSSRSNASHASKTDPDSRLYRKGQTASQLYFMGHALMENRHGLIVDAMVTRASGKAGREAAKAMIGKVATQSKCKANITRVRWHRCVCKAPNEGKRAEKGPFVSAMEEEIQTPSLRRARQAPKNLSPASRT